MGHTDLLCSNDGSLYGVYQLYSQRQRLFCRPCQFPVCRAWLVQVFLFDGFPDHYEKYAGYQSADAVILVPTADHSGDLFERSEERGRQEICADGFLSALLYFLGYRGQYFYYLPFRWRCDQQSADGDRIYGWADSVLPEGSLFLVDHSDRECLEGVRI